MKNSASSHHGQFMHAVFACGCLVLLSRPGLSQSTPLDIEPITITQESKDTGFLDDMAWIDLSAPTAARKAPPPLLQSRNYLWNDAIPVRLDDLGQEAAFAPFLSLTIAELERVTRTYPDDANAWTVLAVRYYQTNIMDQALAAFAQARQADPLHERNAELSSAILVHHSGLDEALTIIRSMLDDLPHNRILRFNAACGYALSGQTNEALYHLSTLVNMGWFDIRHYLNDRDLESLHKNPEWVRLCNSLDQHAREEVIDRLRVNH